MFFRKKQRGAAAIEYAILAAAMSLVLLTMVGGNEGKLTKALNDTYNSVVESLSKSQQDSGN